MKTDRKTQFFLPVFIWGLAALFFLYEFFLRVFVATISDTVISDLDLTAQQFATMGSGYYLIYGIMQLPVGILVERFGARFLLTIATFLAGLGGFWFAFTGGFLSGFLSRCFMGFGSSFAYVCLLVLALNWFPRRHFGLVVGISVFLGALGPMLAGGPLALILKIFHNNWRLVIGVIGLFGFFLAGIIGFFVRNAPPRRRGQIIHLDPYKDPLFKRLKAIALNPQVWFIGFYSGFIYVCLPLLGAYWGVNYLQSRGMSKSIAASITSMLWIGLAIGSPLLGKISDLIKRRKLILSACALIGIVVTIFAVYLPINSRPIYAALFFFIGLASSAQTISFAAIAEHVPPKLHPTAIALNNTVCVLSAAILPSFVSYFVGRSAAAQGEIEGQFQLIDFQAGFFLMPIFYGVAALFSFFFVRETFCRQQFETVKIARKSL